MRTNLPRRPGAGFAVKPGDDAWLHRVDQFTADVKADGRLLKIASRYGLEPIVVGE